MTVPSGDGTTDGFMQPILFSIITPSTGRRPKALAAAVRSVRAALDFAGLPEGAVEMLVGFDGVRGERPPDLGLARFLDLPKDEDWGNGIRDILLKIAKGERVLFLDDDNSLKPHALAAYMDHLDAEMVVARIDTSLAFDKPFIPEDAPGRDPIRQCNVDPLCLSLSRELVVTRCGGWVHKGRYEADFLNIRLWSRRAKSLRLIDDIVATYDSGRSLDARALSRRQMHLLDRLAAERRGPAQDFAVQAAV